MHADITVPLRTIIGFVLVLSRLLGVFVYLPLPGKDTGPSMARIVLAVAMGLAVVPSWSAASIPDPTPSMLVLWVGSELAFGLTIGLVVGFVSEALTVGAHIIALQAGYAYASVVDPTTQADSDVLQVLAQLLGGLLFFTFGLDHMAIRTFVYSLRSFPPGQFALTPDLVRGVLALSAGIFTVGLKLAMPVVALLLTTELALSLVGRLSTQLHLGASASAIKMLLTLLVLVTLLRVLPQVYEQFAQQLMEFLQAAFWGLRPHLPR
jgi:flagellar biosynthetic protein FliR